MWHFKYPLAGGETYEYVEKDEDGNVILREERDYISIATTRPETMLGDGAVAVHPSDERYAPIVGKLCEIPVGPKEHRRLIPIITDEYPDPTFGSGAVKITGAHDFNDYAVAQRGGIPMYRLMDSRARMRDDGEDYATCAARAQEIANGAEFTEAEVDTLNLVPDHLRGLDRMEARDKVVAEITAEGLAVMTHGDDPRLGKAAAKPGSEQAGHQVPLVEASRTSGSWTRKRSSARRWMRCATAMCGSCPRAARRPITTGLRISSPGASPASSGGGIRSRCGTGSTWPAKGSGTMRPTARSTWWRSPACCPTSTCCAERNICIAPMISRP
jgi:hypothetical protein